MQQPKSCSPSPKRQFGKGKLVAEELVARHTGLVDRSVSSESAYWMDASDWYTRWQNSLVYMYNRIRQSSEPMLSLMKADGVLKFTGTYEILSPDDIGLSWSCESGIKLGKLSGRHGLKFRLLKLGYDINGKELDDIFARLKEIAGTKKNFSDDDIEALVHENGHLQAVWSLGDLQVMHGTFGSPTVTVKLISCYGEEKISCSVGEGPVDAAYKAINNIVQIPVVIRKYVNSAMEEGIDALASTQVVVSQDSNEIVVQNIVLTFSGSATGKDIVIASVQAYLNALNKAVRAIDSSAKMLSA
ncbi:hypothetical protein J5N97_020260 [Dioscorea zingiberensis]|uniref:2-isopropylmalate synthase LeuA allosteric (dimerisation) domain-containing protein n=1 Tax=Dioscorea zingiberensis TaxID=325984 RepID=A0A9D5HD27_9LILI|nr:hypothetical protein J5N97_020260 [Dioscorea zingiberensis]